MAAGYRTGPNARSPSIIPAKDARTLFNYCVTVLKGPWREPEIEQYWTRFSVHAVGLP